MLISPGIFSLTLTCLNQLSQRRRRNRLRETVQQKLLEATQSEGRNVKPVSEFDVPGERMGRPLRERVLRESCLVPQGDYIWYIH